MCTMTIVSLAYQEEELEPEEEEEPPPPSPPREETAWERGLRHAKEVRKEK